ncbi:MAG: glycosyltransferase [Phototrophicaceae bacterium]
MKPKVLIFIVAYSASEFIRGVLDRIQDEVWNNPEFDTEVLIIDDQSPDDTFHTADEYTRHHPDLNIVVLHNPINQGYGGNQKIGYHYAIEHGFDAVLLLHGDGQYPSESVLPMVKPILNGEAEAVFGSRMLNKQDALRGKMPLYKWVGNQVLTTVQNTILGATLSEFHTGYRAYRVQTLAQLPFRYNSNYFDFDTDIIIQLLDTHSRILEIPIPTKYGEEISRVNGYRYAFLILISSIRSRLIPMGMFYHPKFDYRPDNTVYELKLGYASTHQQALDWIQAGERVLDLGGGAGYLARELKRKQAHVTVIDRTVQPLARAEADACIETDLEDYAFNDAPDVEWLLLLDTLSELHQPEKVLTAIRQRYATTPTQIVLSIGNIAYFLVRLNLLFGLFNYSRKGLLNLNNRYLFTLASLQQLLQYSGYRIVRSVGIPAPFPLALGDHAFSRGLLTLNQWLIHLVPSLFAYQFLLIIKPNPTLDDLLEAAQRSANALRQSPTPVDTGSEP